MTACKQYQNLLWMDVHGILEGKQRKDWYAHLQSCDQCRQEKKRACEMLDNMKRVMRPTPPPRKTVQAMAAHINHHAFEREKAATKPKINIRKPSFYIPALTAACLLLIATGLFFKTSLTPSSNRMTASTQNITDQIPADDMEIIENIELLTEFDSIKKLIQTVDDPEKPVNDPNNRNNITQKGVPGGSIPVYREWV